MRKEMLRALSFFAAAALAAGLLFPVHGAGPSAAVKELWKKRPPSRAGTAVCAAEPPEESGEQPEAAEDRYGTLDLTDDDLELLARLIWLEARGEPFTGQVAVGEVVLNRMLSPDFPDTMEDVVYQPGQFTPARRIPYVTPEAAQYQAAAEAADGTACVLEADTVFFSGAPQNSRVCAVIGGHYFCAS